MSDVIIDTKDNNTLKLYQDTLKLTDKLLFCSEIPKSVNFKNANLNHLYSHYCSTQSFHRIKLRATIEKYLRVKQSATEVLIQGKVIIGSKNMQIRMLQEILDRYKPKTVSITVDTDNLVQNPKASILISPEEIFKIPLPVAVSKNMIEESKHRENNASKGSNDFEYKDLDASYKSVDDSNYDYFKNYMYRNETIQFINPSDVDFGIQVAEDVKVLQNQSTDEMNDFTHQLQSLSMKYTELDKENRKPALLDFLPDRYEENTEKKTVDVFTRPASFDNLDQTVLDPITDKSLSPRPLDPSDSIFLY